MTSRHARVGIQSDQDWPYGMGKNPEGQRELVAWAEQHNVRLSHAGGSRVEQLRRVVGKEVDLPAESGSWLDHVTSWNREGRPAAVVSQPYRLADGDFANLAQLDQVDGVTVRVSGRGWYGQGTVFVEVWRTDALNAATSG